LSMLAASISFVINVVGNWFLIPLYGAKGAAISTAIAFWFFFFLRTEFAIYAWKPIPRFLLYAYTLILLSLAILSCLYGQAYRLEYGLLWVLIIISALFFFKAEVQFFLSFVANRWRDYYGY